MRKVFAWQMLAVALIATPWHAGALILVTTCPKDAVLVGQTCVDKYEASVWQIPATNLAGKSNAGLITKIKRGMVKLSDLTAGNATEISPSGFCTPAFPGTFAYNGNWTAPLYAVSIPGVHPTGCVTWFQAEQLCRLSGKRLLTNQEWQAAAAGTPDPGAGGNGTTTCNTATTGPVNTASTGNCTSSWGAFDMVGNVWEWVADWVPFSTACPGWGGFSDDYMCLSGVSTTVTGPGALIRGGSWGNGSSAGPLAVYGSYQPSAFSGGTGFRCAR